VTPVLAYILLVIDLFVIWWLIRWYMQGR